jgi:hypothetical protein
MTRFDRPLISTTRKRLICFLGVAGLFAATIPQAQAQPSAACNAVNAGAFELNITTVGPSTSSILTNWNVGETLTVSITSSDGISRSDGLFQGPTFAAGTFGALATTAVPTTGAVTFQYTITSRDLINGIAVDPENDDAVVVACGGAPTVTSVSPNSGSPAGGTTVIITGTNFSVANTSVTFGGIAATSFTVNSSTQITATAPADAVGSVNVVVSTITGTSGSSSLDTYTFIYTALFVSAENGTDSGSCQQTAPCATLNYALQLASAGSVIEIEDGGAFGPIYITQPITINGPADGSASIVWSSTQPGCVGAVVGNCNGSAAANYAVEIAAPASSAVELNNLVIDNGAGTNGAMHIASAASVAMKGNALRGGTGAAPQLLLMDTSQGSLMQLIFNNCDFGFNAAGGGIFMHPSSPVSLNFSGGQIHNLVFGIKLNATLMSSGSSVNAVIDSAELFGFSTNAIAVVATSGGNATATVSRSTISQTGDDAIYVDGAAATALLYNDVITASNTGVQNASSGASVTFGNNDIFSNATNVSGGSMSPAPAGVGGKTQ